MQTTRSRSSYIYKGAVCTTFNNVKVIHIAHRVTSNGDTIQFS